MNARQTFAADAAAFTSGNPSEIVDDFTRTMAEAEPMKVFISWDEFNDDDIYVFCVASSKLIKHHSANSPEVFCARYHGLKVLEGHSWAKGSRAKALSLWRPA